MKLKLSTAIVLALFWIAIITFMVFGFLLFKDGKFQ
jgi:hypothetical protein